MMGIKARAFGAVPPVTLEALVPPEHFYRHLERTLDVSFVRDLVCNTYAATGRPSIDPVVFFKLQLILFFEGLRSERQLMQVVADRLSLRWYVGYDLTEPLPDHSSLTRIRERYGLAVFRRFFEAIVEQCLAAGLVWGKELYLDATKVAANAALASLQPRFAVEAHLAGLFAAEGEDGDGGKASGGPGGADEGDEPAQWPVALTDEARLALTEAAAQRHDWIGKAGRPDRRVIRGTYRRTADFRVSTTDPDATPLPLGDGHTTSRLPGPLRRRWWEGADHPGGLGCSSGGAGEPAGPRSPLAGAVSVEAATAAGDWGHQVRHGREHHCHRAGADSCLHAAVGSGPADRDVWGARLCL